MCVSAEQVRPVLLLPSPDLCRAWVPRCRRVPAVPPGDSWWGQETLAGWGGRRCRGEGPGVWTEESSSRFPDKVPVGTTLLGNGVCRGHPAKLRSHWIGAAPHPMTGVLTTRMFDTEAGRGRDGDFLRAVEGEPQPCWLHGAASEGEGHPLS